MGIQDRDYYREPSRGFGVLADGIQACVGLAVVFVIVFFIQIGTREELRFGPARAGAFTEALQLDSGKVLQGEVWRLLTATFLHDVIHGNVLLPVVMTVLFIVWLGRQLEEIYGWQEFLGYSLLASLIGGIGFEVAAVVLNQPGIHLGPSALITAVLMLYALHFPQRTVLLFFVLPTPIWLLVVGYALLDILGLFGGGVQVAVVAIHLSAASFAYLYHRNQLRVTNWLPSLQTTGKKRRTKKTSLHLFDDTTEPEGVLEPVSPQPRANSHRVGPTPAETRQGPPAEKMDEQLEALMDAVLEKMNKFGKESLTDEDWAILRRASEICQQRRREPS